VTLKSVGMLCLAAAAGCAPNRPTQPVEPVYRYINVRGGSRLSLGEPFRRGDLATRVDDTTYALRPGTFGGGGTTAITVHTDGQQILRRMAFVYDGSESLATKIRDYTASLGKPKQRRTESDSVSVHVWEDAETRFELHYHARERPPFWSQLIDRRK
jgi:hypothetical protein